MLIASTDVPRNSLSLLWLESADYSDSSSDASLEYIELSSSVLTGDSDTSEGTSGGNSIVDCSCSSNSLSCCNPVLFFMRSMVHVHWQIVPCSCRTHGSAQLALLRVRFRQQLLEVSR